jgi:hypothetical protein
MSILISAWYIFSGILGVLLGAGGFLCFFVGSILLIMGIWTSIEDNSVDEIPVILCIVAFCTVFSLTSYFVNINVVKNQKQVSFEVSNIVSYNGNGEERINKGNYDFMYFMQGTNNNYTTLKLDINRCKIHYTTNNNVKIIENNTEYLSPLRYLAIFSLNNNTYYDVYLPEKYK